jgi:GNAT superfamily N-acetyltransferase
MTAVAIRSARKEDAGQLARLLDQLGHGQTGDTLRGQLAKVLADPRGDVLVAVDDSETLVGAATYYFVPVAHDNRPWCRITSLVVDEARRGEGIGHMLLKRQKQLRERLSAPASKPPVRSIEPAHTVSMKASGTAAPRRTSSNGSRLSLDTGHLSPLEAPTGRRRAATRAQARRS